MTQGSYICGRCNSPKAALAPAFTGSKAFDTSPGPPKSTPRFSRCSSLRQFYQTHSERNWQEGSASLAFPARSSRRSSFAILRSRRSRRGWAPLSGSNGFYKRRPAGQRLRLARGGIHRLAGEPWQDYPNRRGDRRHWNRRDRRHADPYEPTAIRAGMGSLFLQRLVRCSAREFTDWARAFDVALVGSSPTGLLDYRAFRCRWPAALLIGSEKHGLSDQLAEACDFMVRIPMVGRGDSINAAVAAGILLYELFNRRRALQGGYGESSSVHAG